MSCMDPPGPTGPQTGRLGGTLHPGTGNLIINDSCESRPPQRATEFLWRAFIEGGRCAAAVVLHSAPVLIVKRTAHAIPSRATPRQAALRQVMHRGVLLTFSDASLAMLVAIHSARPEGTARPGYCPLTLHGANI